MVTYASLNRAGARKLMPITARRKQLNPSSLSAVSIFPTSTPVTAISNRNWKLLGISVTHTKHSPGPVSNRNKNTFAWGSQFWLRNAARTRLNCACTSDTRVRRTPKTLTDRRTRRRLPAEAGSPLSRSGRLPFVLLRIVNFAGLRLSHAQPAPTGSSVVTLGPRWLRAISRTFARQRTACAAGYSTAPPLQRHAPSSISNRQWKGLETAATPTKQSTDSFLIDNENGHAWGRHSCLRNHDASTLTCADAALHRRKLLWHSPVDEERLTSRPKSHRSSCMFSRGAGLFHSCKLWS